MKQLVFVHGRSQQRKDAAALKAEWIAAWRKGLDGARLPMPLAESDIRFPYYGDTLFELAAGLSPDEAAHVVIKGRFDTGMDSEEREFIRDVLLDVQRERGISEADVIEVTGREFSTRGILNWGWVQSLLETIDRRIPFASGASIALATRDVYHYLQVGETREKIENGVRGALRADVATVVVGHSLGTVVAYNLLRREGKQQGWNIPLFVTLGSPLGVDAMRRKLAPIEHPACVRRWFNAYDPRDVVALFPLDEDNFDVDPPIVNKGDVNNLTTNRHGISGYLADPEVARAIHAALQD